MKLFNTVVLTPAELREFLGLASVVDAAASAVGILVQAYVGHGDDAWISHIVAAVQEALPRAIIVGASSSGEISDGRVTQNSTLLSVAFFRSANLKGSSLPCARGAEFSSGRAIGDSFSGITGLRGVLLLAPPTRLDCSQILAGLQSALPETAVFGGGAADAMADGIPRIFFGAQRYESGCVAVALSGLDLHVQLHVLLGWQALGPKMTLTRVDGFSVRSIDGKPAVEAYRKYLRIEPDDRDIYLLEFPLLIERHGLQLARNPVAMGDDGSVSLVADVRCGETARLGYLDVDAAVTQVSDLMNVMQRDVPEAVMLYSCVCRRFTLQQDVELETLPFQAIAPVGGFFTYGEFCRIGNRLQLLNSSEVVVTMREGPAKGVSRPAGSWALAERDRNSFRHSRITSRLFRLVTALTDELEEANSKLRDLSKRDALTGLLNRHSLDSDLQNEWLRSKRYRYEMAILMLDLDNFKQLNDIHGHAVGDRVLSRVACAIRDAIRTSDTVYRYGGEEFLVLLPQTPMPGALESAEKIRLAVECLADSEGAEFSAVTCSIGVACYPGDGEDIVSVVKEADRGLYRAKALGRNRTAMSPFAGSGQEGKRGEPC